MYNKLFAKILDSSVWLEPTPTRIVWLTLIAAMDEDGMVQFASVSNVAHRARVSEDEAEKAIQTLESPDKNSADPDNEGRRIERVPGGWIVLNSKKYRDLSNREIAKEKTRQRVAKFRAKQRCNGGVTPPNDSVTTSEAYTDTCTDTEKTISTTSGYRPSLREIEQVYALYPLKKGKGAAFKAIKKALTKSGFEKVLASVTAMAEAWKNEPDKQFCPHASTWFNEERYDDPSNGYAPHSHFKPNPRNLGIATNPIEQGKAVADLIARKNGKLNPQPELGGITQ